ncbi:MAG: hypothetical protein AAF570_22400 [Bacteroidota bacterium]
MTTINHYVHQSNPTRQTNTNFLQQVFSIFLAILRFFFVIEAPVARQHRQLIQGLFIAYAIPAFMIFGAPALLLMAMYQGIFKLGIGLMK